ncbi:MAG: DMT family transporter [Rickettsiales bacterium]
MSDFVKNNIAILYMLAAMFCMSVTVIFIKILGKDIHFTQAVAIRHICSIVIVLIWSALLTRRVKPDFHSNRMSGHFWRATFGICAMELWFYAISIMPVTLVTAISFIIPIFSAILAIIFLGERVGIHRWAAIFTGFLGVLIILRPDTGGIGSEAWVALVSALLIAGSGVMIKSLSSSEKPETMVFYMSFFMLMWSIPIAIPFWGDVNVEQLYIIFMISLASTCGHLLMARAFARSEMVVLLPFDFTRLIFVAIMAYRFLDEVLDFQTIIGSIVIALSAIYITYREAKKKKESIKNI